MTQLRELATPFKGHLVKAPPKGKFGSYVSHSTVNERALSVVGPHSFDIIEVVRSHDGRVAGVLGRLTAVIDGTEVTVTEAGDEEHPDQGTDGANLKNAASDAYKRCWMRLGLGLHLWSQDDYFLDKQLDKNAHPTTEMRDGAGNLIGYRDSITDKVITEGQAALPVNNDPERPFE